MQRNSSMTMFLLITHPAMMISAVVQSTGDSKVTRTQIAEGPGHAYPEKQSRFWPGIWQKSTDYGFLALRQRSRRSNFAAELNRATWRHSEGFRR
jgi:hypothetical protein